MAYAACWLYFLNWAMTSIADVTAAALYLKFWGPELFRELADRGAQIIIVTAHWGAGEGKVDAWCLLNQARAIDSTSWIIACDQADASTAGIEEPSGPRFGVGHSLVVSPMGVVLKELDETVGQLLVTADIAAVEKARQVFPVLANRKIGITV